MSVGRLTLDQLEIIELEQNPTSAPGVSGPVGSLGLMDNGSGLFYKFGSNNTDWIDLKNFKIEMFNSTVRHTENLRFYSCALNSRTNGIVTVNPTSDGTGSGSALFSEIFYANCVPSFTPGNVYQAPFCNLSSISVDLRTVTFRGYRGVSQGILLGGTVNTIERMPAGIPCRVFIAGLGV